MDEPPALELRSVSKRYRLRDGGELAAVDSLSLEVRRGEIVALLGPNGAGKTTAMQLALGLLHPDAGEARLFGGHPEVLATRRRIGYAPDAPLFPKALTGFEVLALHGELLGHRRAEAKTRAVRRQGRRVDIRLVNAARISSRIPELVPGAALDGDRLSVEIAGENAVPAIVRRLVEGGADVLEVRLAGAELEEMYLHIVE